MGCWTPTICDSNHCKGGEGGNCKRGEVPTGIKRPKTGDRATIDMETERPKCRTDIVADRRKGVHETMRKRCGIERNGILSRNMGLRIRGNRSGSGGEEKDDDQLRGEG